MESTKIGIVVDEATTGQFTVACDPKEFPSQWEYLMVNSEEIVNGKMVLVQILAQNIRNVYDSPTLSRDLGMRALERLTKHNLGDVKFYCEVQTLGYFSPVDAKKRQVLMPRRPLRPGTAVFIAPTEFLKDFFQAPEAEALKIGTLISRPGVDVSISVNGFRRHLAILAQTGGGKSYTTGVILEELYEKGATIIIIDPHADYALLNRDAEGHARNKNIVIYRNPNSSSRFTIAEMGKVEEYTVQFGSLTANDVAELAHIPESASNQRALIEWAISALRKKLKITGLDADDDVPEGTDVRYTPKDLVDLLLKARKQAEEQEEEESDEEEGDEEEEKDSVSKAKGTDELGLTKHQRKLIRQTASSVISRVKRFSRRKVFGQTRVPLSEFLQPQKISDIDLSGLEHVEQDYIVKYLLTELYDHFAAADDPRPVFLFVEEAHNFVPNPSKKRGESRSMWIINKIASEGRKFGMFLVLITQRPQKVDSDSLSQCNSQIILRVTNPKDQTAIQDSSERVSHDLLGDLPGLNVGEAIIVGQATKIPIMAKIRPRQTKEGGRDIDVVAKLQKALEEAEADKKTILPTAKSARAREEDPF